MVGGGVSGLAAAVALTRSGHAVTVIERDHTPMPHSPDEAFEWDRRGAPQVRHSHAFLARLRNLLRDQYPDIYAALLNEGATEMRFGEDLPPEMTGFEPEPGDEDLAMIACRRTTFEWVLRRAALGEGRVTFRTGVAATGVLTKPRSGGEPLQVVGVRLSDGTEIPSDLVIAAAGRRSAMPEWLESAGAAPISDTVDDTGIVYFSRFYRLLPNRSFPARSGPIGGDLGYVKYGVFAGDNRTFSITLASSTEDEDLRKRFLDPVLFDTAARQLVATAPYLDGRAEPITADVHVMAGLVNRWRDYVVDGEPVALGVVPIGDAVLCTNPLYGRGCSTAFWGAHLLTQAISDHDGDPRATAIAYDQALRAQIFPWYQASVDQDKDARRVSAALLAGEDPDSDNADPRTFMRGVFRDGLLPALRSDAVVLRSFFRSLNLLSSPDAMMRDAEVGARVFAVWQDRDQRPPTPLLGPANRNEFLALLRV